MSDSQCFDHGNYIPHHRYGELAIAAQPTFCSAYTDPPYRIHHEYDCGRTGPGNVADILATRRYWGNYGPLTSNGAIEMCTVDSYPVSWFRGKFFIHADILGWHNPVLTYRDEDWWCDIVMNTRIVLTVADLDGNLSNEIRYINKDITMTKRAQYSRELDRLCCYLSPHRLYPKTYRYYPMDGGFETFQLGYLIPGVFPITALCIATFDIIFIGAYIEISYVQQDRLMIHSIKGEVNGVDRNQILNGPAIVKPPIINNLEL